MPPFPLSPPFPANESLVSSYAVVNPRGGNERRGEERRVVVGDAKGIFFFFSRLILQSIKRCFPPYSKT